MDKWQRTWLIFRNTWVESTAQIEFFISLLSVATISGILTYNDYLSYAKIIGLVTVPEVLIRVINSPYSYFFIVGGLFIYLMQAPYFSSADTLLLPRIDRGPWIWGKILFVAGFVLLALLLSYTFTLLLCAPFIDFHRWAWTQSLVEQRGLGESLFLLSPGRVLIQMFLLNYLFLLFMALIAMLLNLCYSRLAAPLIACTVCASSTVILYVFPQFFRWGIALHASLYYHSFFGQDNMWLETHIAPTVPESLLLFAAGCILCLILIRYRVRNYDFQLESKGMH